ncbi:hypothetical protein DFS33DRAFT_1269964 [Desarmillaria ectypa]|nr:hypothetical protein DFS33DRAFT_1269964 [Desarmillaria ectypa]
MGAVISAFTTAAAAAIPIILNAIRNSKVQEIPTLSSISQHHRRGEASENEARRRIKQLEREKKEQADKAEKEKKAALKAIRRSNKLQDEMKAKEKVIEETMEAQKAMEAKWKKGVYPVEWPSQAQYNRVKQRLYMDGKFHLAIAGKSGTDKSSLINAFRGIWDGHEGSATTDVVESTTFDIPGSGTVNCPDWTYFNDQGLYIFDAIIVLLGDRFTDGDLAILKNCQRYNISTYIVRSKSERQIEELVKKKQRCSGTRSDPIGPIGIHDEARREYLVKTQETVRVNLMNLDLSPLSQRVYAVSRDTLTLLVREEFLEDLDVLDEHELLKDILQDAYSRRSEKSWRVMQDLIKNAGCGAMIPIQPQCSSGQHIPVLDDNIIPSPITVTTKSTTNNGTPIHDVPPSLPWLNHRGSGGRRVSVRFDKSEILLATGSHTKIPETSSVFSAACKDVPRRGRRLADQRLHPNVTVLLAQGMGFKEPTPEVEPHPKYNDRTMHPYNWEEVEAVTKRLYGPSYKSTAAQLQLRYPAGQGRYDGLLRLYCSCGNCKSQCSCNVYISDVYAEDGEILTGINSNYSYVFAIPHVGITQLTRDSLQQCESPLHALRRVPRLFNTLTASVLTGKNNQQGLHSFGNGYFFP